MCRWMDRKKSDIRAEDPLWATHMALGCPQRIRALETDVVAVGGVSERSPGSDVVVGTV